MPTLKKQTASGVKWLVGSSFLQKVIQTGATIVLARILGPSQFGIFALAFVAIDALGLFKSMGFDSALIQRKDNIERAANTAFFVIPVLGVVLYLLLSVSAPWIGKFFNNQEVIGVIRALGIIFIISCLGRVPAALLEKNMKFKKVSIIEIGTAVVFAVSAITFALLKFGIQSLVYAYILKTLYQNILMFICSKWKPKFEFDPIMLLSQMEENSAAREYLLEIQKGLHRIGGITKSLVEFSYQVNSEAPQRKNHVDLGLLIDECLDYCCARLNGKLKIKRHYPQELPRIMDLGVSNVFRNLIKNAVDAMPEGGLLEIAIEDKDSFLKVSFKDSGTGISEELREQIFEPFFTTKSIYQGSGLGLAICREIIDRYGGRIDLVSEVGKGSTFTVSFPEKWILNV